jgi:hypothetical protein
MSCCVCSVAAASVAARFGWRSLVVGGRSWGNCAPVVGVVLTPLAVGWVVGTGEGAVAPGVGVTVGVEIVDVVAVGPSRMVGTAVATIGGAILGGAITGPDRAVTPCALAAPVVLPPSASSPPTSSLSGCLKGAMGQRPTLAGGGPSTYLFSPARKPATQSVPYSQAIWVARPQIPILQPPTARPLHFQVGVWVDHCESLVTLLRPLRLGGNTRRSWNAQVSLRSGWSGSLA